MVHPATARGPALDRGGHSPNNQEVIDKLGQERTIAKRMKMRRAVWALSCNAEGLHEGTFDGAGHEDPALKNANPFLPTVHLPG